MKWDFTSIHWIYSHVMLNIQWMNLLDNRNLLQTKKAIQYLIDYLNPYVIMFLPETENSIKIAIRIRFDSTHSQQNIVFFVLCSTYYVCVQKQLSISPWSTLFSCARVYFSQDNYSTNEDLNNQKENKHT